MKISAAVLLPAALGLFPAGAAAQGVDSLPPGVTADMLDTGRQLFAGAGLCAACHGAEAQGAVGPNLTDDEWLHGDGSFDAIVDRIAQGVPADQSKSGVPMPPTGGGNLDDDQIRAVGAYVWSLSRADQ